MVVLKTNAQNKRITDSDVTRKRRKVVPEQLELWGKIIDFLLYFLLARKPW